MATDHSGNPLESVTQTTDAGISTGSTSATEGDSERSSQGIAGFTDLEYAASLNELGSRGVPLFVVGIGASAGGIDALQEMLASVPEESGLAFVVVMHLSPDHESRLAELLQQHTGIPVEQVTQSVELRSNHVYVIPPNSNLETIDTHLRLSALEPERRHRAPIDHFFRTLATTREGNAIGVILSGTGSDGALGIKEIKGHDGFVIIQDPNEAEYDGMPNSALATGLVDEVLPIREIVDRVLSFARTQPRILLPSDGEIVAGNQSRVLQQIFAQIRSRTGRDFSKYKQSTIIRRIRRRMQLHHIEDLEQYLRLLRESGEEVGLLAEDMLITVTNFFRDPAVFDYMAESIIPRLLQGKTSSDELRIWSVGCATGEEAYSTAMLLVEKLSTLTDPPRVQLFASDLHERSLRSARESFYPGDIESDVTPERLQRFFVQDHGGYRVRKEIREMVVFAPHNLLRDPPFSRLDAIICRNVLIYLQREIQRDIAGLFHYALKPNGFLVVGSSDTVDSGELFEVDNQDLCVYRRRDVEKADSHRMVFSMPTSDPWEDHGGRSLPSLTYGQLHGQMLERFAPPSILVTPDMKIVHFSENVGRFLQHPGGEPTSNVFKLVREEFRVELRVVLHAAMTNKRPIASQPVNVGFSDESTPVVLHVWPAQDQHYDGFSLVIFDEQRKAASDLVPIVEESFRLAETDLRVRLAKVENELAQARRRLQVSLEQHETTQEEVRAANEELQSANEELRSTLEELETSKEELQSMNEELQTVNQENRHKIEELAQLSDDLQNLLSATDIATLFLDRELRILRFTPRVTDLINVRTIDRGRPLSDLTHHLCDENLIQDAHQVLCEFNPIEREVSDHQGNCFLLRVLPYHSHGDRVDGVVITFVDITARRHAEEAMEQGERLLSMQFDVSQQFHALSTRLHNGDDRQQVYVEILDLAMSVLDADCAHLQSLERDTSLPHGGGRLRLLAHRGFTMETVRHFETIEETSTTASGRVLRSGERVLVCDIAQDDALSDADRLSYTQNEIRAVLSTRLYSRERETLGSIAVHWKHPHHPPPLQLAAFDVVARLTGTLLEQIRTDEKLKKLNLSLEEQVSKRTAMLKLLQDITRTANEARTSEQALYLALERLSQYDAWSVGHVWQLADGDERALVSTAIWYVASTAHIDAEKLNHFRHLSEKRRYVAGDELIGSVLESGLPNWLDDLENSDQWTRGNPNELGLTSAIAFPVFVEGKVVAVMEFLSDHPAKREDHFFEIMPDVGLQLGQVVERQRFDRRVAAVTEREQRRIGQDIHDGVGQEIAGLKYLAQTHADLLFQKGMEEAGLAQRIAIGFETIQRHMRRIIRDLVPVEVDTEGLAAALASLARRTREDYGIGCDFQFEGAVGVENSLLATHLYRIAQEAVSNAVKHSRAKQIRIALELRSGVLRLSVVDDGIGITAPPATGDKFGLHGMLYRAELVGGQLSIENRAEGGTSVTCTVPFSTGSFEE